MDCKNKRDIGNNMGDWTRIIIIQTVPEQCTGKPHKGITENSHIGYCADTAGSIDVKAENFQHGK